jgi:hypothetical protein
VSVRGRDSERMNQQVITVARPRHLNTYLSIATKQDAKLVDDTLNLTKAYATDLSKNIGHTKFRETRILLNFATGHVTYTLRAQ